MKIFAYALRPYDELGYLDALSRELGFDYDWTPDYPTLENAHLAAGADIIMLDNMSCPDMKKAVDIVSGRAVLEASGNMGDRDLKEVAATGVDIISIGALTHSVKALDISLKFKLV